MSRVVRKETLHIHVNMGRKSDLEILISYFSIAVELSVETSIDRLSIEQLSSFNESALLHLFLGQICMASILDLKSCSLKY